MHHSGISSWQRARTTCLAVVGAIGFVSPTVYAQQGKDMGPSPVWSERNRGRSDNTPYQPSQAEIAAQQAEQARQQQLSEAVTANNKGVEFFNKQDWANAVPLLEEAARKNPHDPVIQQNLSRAKTALEAQLTEAREKARIERQDKAAAANMQQAINSFARSLTAAPPMPITGGLDFESGNSGNPSRKGGLEFISTAPAPRAAQPAATLEFGDPTAPTRRGAFGSNESNAKFATADARTPGSNTKAGDQLMSAAAEASKGRDSNLAMNFDVGGAASAGSLVAAHTASAGPPPPMDLSRFSERAKKDPEIIASLGRLSELQAIRSELDTQRAQLTKERNLTKEPDAMKALTEQLTRKEHEYQANLAAITVKTEQIEKRHREIDNTVEETPAGATSKAAIPGTN